MNSDEKPLSLEEEIQEAERVLLSFQHLSKSKGWVLLLEYADAIVADHEVTALAPMENILEVPKGEYSKGYAKGVRDILALPAIQIAVAKETKAAVSDQLEAGDTGESDDDFET